MHPGHIYFLESAKKLGNKLVVVLTNDSNNKKPYAVPARQRKKLLESVELADEVLIGDVKDMAKVVEIVKPDVVALGYDQKMPPGLDKIKFVRIKKFGSYSTSSLLVR